MDNLDFGWQFAILALLLGIVYYYVVAVINYTLVVFLGRFLKRFTDQTTPSKKNSIIQIGIPFFLSAIIIEIAKIYGKGWLPNFFSWNSIFLDPSYYHLPGIYAYL